MELVDIYAACRRIAPYVHRTPLFTSRLLDELLGKRLLLKAEHLQKTGSFKARGALSKALTLENPKGLLAVSSGNHAQGVAYAAQVLYHPTLACARVGAPERTSGRRHLVGA